MAKKRKFNRNHTNQQNRGVEREQPRKDSDAKRVNFDNARIDKLERDVEKGEWGKTRGKNDFAWINRNPKALEGAANVSTMFQTGEIFPWYDLSADENSYPVSVPAVMALNFTPNLTTASMQALNQAAASLYSYVVHANSRNRSYDAPDLMLNVVGASQIFSMIAKGIRLYGTMRKFSGENLRIPRDLVKAQGFNYNDILTNYSKMWFDLNLRIARIQDVWVPRDIPLLQRWFWINTNIYVDSSSIKDQMYILNMCNYLKYSEVSSASGGELVQITNITPSQWIQSSVTWAMYLKALDEMIDAHMNSQDRGIMAGDLLRAYGWDKLYRLNEIDINYQVLPTYDPEVLSEIMNATLAPNTMMSRLSQDPDKVTLNAHFKYYDIYGVEKTPPATYTHANCIPDYVYMNFKDTIEPTYQQVALSAQWAAAGMTKVTVDGGTANILVPRTAGTETLFNYVVYYAGWTASGKRVSERTIYYSDNSNPGAEKLSPISAFDWRPAQIIPKVSDTVVSTDTNLPKVFISGWFREVEYGFPLHFSVLERIHSVELYSYLGVPVDGSSASAK